jgi:hypothetical protein
MIRALKGLAWGVAWATLIMLWTTLVACLWFACIQLWMVMLSAIR